MRETNSSKTAHTHYSLLHELDGSLLESFIQPLLGSLPHLCSKHKKVNTFVSYNTLNLRKACRTSDILSELKHASVVAMQGTRLRQSNNLDMHVSNVGNFRVFHCGYPPKGNAHGGVAIAINTTITPEKQIHSFAYPDDSRIAGRVMAVRIKTESSDELHVCAYFPPATTKHAIKHTQLMLNWINQLFKKKRLSERCQFCTWIRTAILACKLTVFMTRVPGSTAV